VTFEVRINASVSLGTIIKNCVLANSVQTDPAESCARTIVTPIVPLLVNKTVCDPGAHKWVDELNGSNVSIGDTLRFRCEVHNNETSELTSTLVGDFLSKNLEYADDATVRYPSGWTVRREPDYKKEVNLTIKNQTITIGTLFIYYFPLSTLKPSESITIEYNAKLREESGVVVEYKAINIQFAGGYYKETEEWGFGYDYVTITDLEWPCDISVPRGPPRPDNLRQYQRLRR